MQTRRSTGVSPLAIVLPHPSLPRRRSSLLSSSPQTPRSCPSPTCSSIYFYPANRKSTDSWNSSNGPDELESDWKPDQVLLLSRTLDALPAHLVTPFNGPIPPSNLLDKIARGVSQAKGPADWPHSIRSTRVKLIELSRSKAKEDALADQRRKIITEEPQVEIEDGSNYSYIHDGAERPITLGSKRPLYRQSSMDFIKSAGTDIKDNDNIARLSNRLQRSDRIFSNPGYHPYARASRAHANRRSSSPPPLANVPSLISPSTQSSDTLNSLSSFSSRPPRGLRRSASTLSSMSILTNSSNGAPIPDPRVQRVRRSDTFCAPAPPPKDTLANVAGIKRAPSYGTLAQEARREHVTVTTRHARKDSGSYPSSDEEEKQRSKMAKKQRTRTGAAPMAPESPIASSPPASSVPSSPSAGSLGSPIASRPPPVPAKDRTHVVKSKPKTTATGQEGNAKSPKVKKSSAKVDSAKVDTQKVGEKRPAPMNLQRNPNMFGAELPHLRIATNNVVAPPSPVVSSGGIITPTKIRSPSPANALTLSPIVVSSPPTSPVTQKVRTLRRVRRLAPARRISFGSLVAPMDEGDADCEEEYEQPTVRGCLGSAFQLL